MDVSRTINRLRAKEVMVVYRRTEKQMPADPKEIEAAKKEGVKFLFQTNIAGIYDNNTVDDLVLKENTSNLKIECIQTELIKKEGENREIPINIEGSQFKMKTDYVIRAIGSSPNQMIIQKLGLNTNEKGYIQIDENYQTSDERIYAIGDLIGTKQTVAWAAKTGFDCAKEIYKLI